MLAKLGQRFGSPAMGEPSKRPSSVQDKWKMGAKKALLQWCRQQVTAKFGIQVDDFGNSWRDGNAFLGIVNSIKPGTFQVQRQTL